MDCSGFFSSGCGEKFLEHLSLDSWLPFPCYLAAGVMEVEMSPSSSPQPLATEGHAGGSGVSLEREGE